jgi:hypothetical protein
VSDDAGAVSRIAPLGRAGTPSHKPHAEYYEMNMQTKPPAPRTVLRQAIADRDAAAGRERTAAAALDQADHNIAGPRLRLHLARDVDAEILADATARYRAFAEAGGDAPTIDVPEHLAEKRRQRDTAKAELDAAKAAQAQLARAHADAQTERQQYDRRVAAAADAVLADMALPALGVYARAIREARQAWGDAAAIVRLVVPTAPAWAPDMHMPQPALPNGVREMLERGFGSEPSPCDQSHPPARAAAWEDLRRRLRENADAEM